MITALYVDDEQNLLKLTKIYLEKGGEFRIDTAQSVDEAFLMMDKKSYDAVISDYQMPVKDGIEFLSIIRSAGNTIPFILFTGKGREDVVIQAINNGADFYIQKGGDPMALFAELSHKLKIAVDRKKNADEIIRKNEELSKINRRLELTEEELRENLAEINRKRGELAESANQLQQIITFLPDPTFAIDTGGQVIAWNRAMEKLSGVKADEIMGKGDYEYSCQLYGIKRPILIDLVLNPGLEKEYSFPPVISDGNQIFSERSFSCIRGEKGVTRWFTASPLFDIDGKITGAIESLREVTSIKRAERLLMVQRNLGVTLGKTSTLRGAINAVLESAASLEEADSCGVYIAHGDSGLMRLEASAGVSNEYIKNVSVLKLKNSDLISKAGSEEFFIDETNLKGFNPEWMKKEGITCYHGAKLIYENKILGFLVCSSHTLKEMSPEMKASVEALATQASGAIFRIKMSEEQRKTRKNLESFFDEIEDYLYVTDSSGIILMTNSSLQKYTGYEEEELIGQHIAILHPPDYRDEIGVVLNGIFEGNLESNFIPIMTKTGEIVPAETKVTRGIWGGKTAVFGVTRNISELKKAHDRILESERRMRAVFDQSFQLAGILDKKGRVLYANRTALKLIDVDFGDIKGKYLWESGWWKDLPDMQNKIRDAVGMSSGGVTVKSEITIPDRDGFIRHLDFSLRPVRDEKGEIIYLVPEAIDITRRKKAEAALIQANHKLLLLNSITRHDILNRITPVLAYLEMAKMEGRPPKMLEVVEKLKSQVLDIEKLIKFTGLYDELGVAEPSWQDIRKMTGSLHVPRDITFKINIPGIEVYADPMLEKVFSNLLDNSLMHGKEVSEISVSCSRSSEVTSIFWKDNGRGVPEDKKETIFLRGYGDNSGLGLFLSREILSITDIRILECGKEGEGAVFEIIIPPGGCRSLKNNEKDLIENI
ncbi:MAG: PAS domain S-box protein [Methanomicrobiaceae archaeon]|nr:PAS domain S-box protein [Methanomicrobiaceae archaeon]